MDDPLSRAIAATTRHAIRDDPESAYAFDRAVFVLHDSLARIRSVVEAMDAAMEMTTDDWEHRLRTLRHARAALTDDDRKLLEMDH